MEVEKKFRFGEVKTEELKAEHQEVMSLECVVCHTRTETYGKWP